MTNELNVTVSNLQSIPKNLIPLLPKPDTNIKLSAQDQLLFTIQHLHKHAVKLYRSLYLHFLHIKEKDEQIVRFRNENDVLKSKMKTTTDRLSKEKALFMEQLGITWIQMSKKLNRMDLLEFMEEEWIRVNNVVRKEMSNATSGAPLKLSQDQSLEQSNDFNQNISESLNSPTTPRSFRKPFGNQNEFSSNNLLSGSISGTVSGSGKRTRRFREPAGPSYDMSPTSNLDEFDSPRSERSQYRFNTTLIINSESERVKTIHEEGEIFQYDTKLVQFLKKYAAEGFLDPDMSEFTNSEEYQYLKRKAELDDMTMTDELLTQWLWYFENNEELKEKIRRQNRFAGIIADSELSFLNKKIEPIDHEQIKKDQEELERLRKEMERYKKRYGELEGDDDEFLRKKKAEMKALKEKGQRHQGQNEQGQGKSKNVNSSHADGKYTITTNINYNDYFSPDDPAHPNHPDHLKYILDLQKKAKELERLKLEFEKFKAEFENQRTELENQRAEFDRQRAEFEKQKNIMKKKINELNTQQNNPKYVSDIDEKILMDRIYDYRRLLQDKEIEIQRLKEALREREKRKLKRNGQLNVFEFMALNDLKDLKLSDITDSFLKSQINENNNIFSMSQTLNPSSFIIKPEKNKINQPADSILDVSSIPENLEDRKENVNWMNNSSNTFITSIRRPMTAAAGKIHPSTVPVIKNASEVYIHQEGGENNYNNNNGNLSNHPNNYNNQNIHNQSKVQHIILNSNNPNQSLKQANIQGQYNSTSTQINENSTFPQNQIQTIDQLHSAYNVMNSNSIVIPQRSTSPLKQDMMFGDTAHYELRPKTSHNRRKRDKSYQQTHPQVHHQSLQINKTSKTRAKSALGYRRSRTYTF